METSVIIHVVFNELFLFKLPSDFGFFQEKTLIFKEYGVYGVWQKI